MDRSKRRKLRLEGKRTRVINLMGGSCARCGYNEFHSGLQFHHVIPMTKRNSVSKLWENNEYDLMAEVNKCILLCANCHMSLEAGEWEAHYAKASLGYRLTYNT